MREAQLFEAPCVTGTVYAILAAAIQAKSKLPYLNSRSEREECLELMEIGRGMVARLERWGVQLPPLDLFPE